VSLSPEKLQNLLEYTVRKINNVGVEEAAFESIAPIMGTCNVDDALNSEDAVNTIMELFIKGVCVGRWASTSFCRHPQYS
jgi:hypothetical protein